MKKERLQNAAEYSAKADPVCWSELSWPIYKVLELFYEEHEKVAKPKKGQPEPVSLLATVRNDMFHDEPPFLRPDMRQTPEEEGEYATKLLRAAQREWPAGVRQAFRKIHVRRRLDADLQILIDFTAEVLKAAGSRIDWDKDPNREPDSDTYKDVDPTELPEIP